MIEQKLHQYDVALGQYALNNIRGYLDKPAFAAFVEHQLAPPVLTYLKSLGGDDEPQPLLLTDLDFHDLAATSVGGRWSSTAPGCPTTCCTAEASTASRRSGPP